MVETQDLNRQLKITRDSFITKAMCECWHEWIESGKCSCGYWSSHNNNHCTESNNNFSTWNGFGKLWEWSHKQDWFGEFGEAWTNKLFWDEMIDPDVFANAVYQYLKERHE